MFCHSKMKPEVTINKVRSLLVIAGGAPFAFAGISIYRGDEKFYKNILMPVVHQALNPEDAHRFAIWCAKKRLVPHQHNEDLPILKTTVMGLEFNNPIGLAAGFDKDGEAVYGISNAGFGFVEVGSVTPQPQPGNPKPRVFRLTEDEGVINRSGSKLFLLFGRRF